jgi:beta-galactosidase
LGPGGAASGFTTPFNIPRLEEKLDFVGFDIYSKKHLYKHIKTVASYVVGTSRFPYIPEFIAGVWAWYLHPGDEKDEEFVTKAALMQGIKGFSRYMLVERDKWFFSPIRRDGGIREMASMHQRMNGILQGVDFGKLKRESDVLLLANREYDRLEASSVLVSFPGDFLETPSGFSEYPNQLTEAEEDFGFDSIPQKEKNAFFNAFNNSLRESGTGFLLSDTDLNSQRWKNYRAVVLPTVDWLDAGVQESLVAYAQEGGTVVIGPKIPGLGHTMNKETILADALGIAPGRVETTKSVAVGKGRIVVVPTTDDAEAIGTMLRDQDKATAFSASSPAVDVVIHDDVTDSHHKVVFVCNPTDSFVKTNVAISDVIESVTELWGDEHVTLAGGELELTLPAYTIAICDCQTR